MLIFPNDEERLERVERIVDELQRKPAPGRPIRVQAIGTGLLDTATPTLILIAKSDRS
jgi:hypothetical protein